jgi:hypothetical protein
VAVFLQPHFFRLAPWTAHPLPTWGL